MPHGSAVNRPGLQYVNTIKDSTKPARLIAFSFSNSQTFAIEMGAGYFRFHTQGATLTVLGLPYEVANSFTQAELASVRYVQSGDVMTFVHPNHPPAELKRLSNTNWTYSNISFASQTASPTGVTAVATYPTAGVAQTFNYKVTALNSLGYEESLGSTASNSVTNDLTIAANYNTITWTAVTGAVRYNIYKYAAGNYGYIGQVTTTSFKDDNITADLTRSLPILDPIFNSTGNYPSAVCYYEQRRFFAGTLNQPDNIWSTQSGSDYNTSYSIPSQSSDALRFRIAAQRANAIQHMVPSTDLMVLTASTEWRVYSGGDVALTPTSLTVKAQSQNGCATIQPVTVNNFILYAQAQGGHIREMSYQYQAGGFVSNDVCLLSPHLFNNYTLVDMAFSRAPTPIVWAISSTGKLLGMTYVPEQEVASWHQHDTLNGAFEACVTVTENNADVLYTIVKRTINGQTVRYIECLHSRLFNSQADAFFVDSGITYNGSATNILSGLTWLEGETVSILGDGAVMPQQVVSNGTITLPVAVSTAQIGLPITADLQTTPAYMQGDGAFGQSRVKNINNVYVRVYNSGAFSVGPNTDTLTPIPGRHYENPGTAPALFTDEVRLFITPDYNQSGQVTIRQAEPLPLSIVNITLDCTIGG